MSKQRQHHRHHRHQRSLAPQPDLFVTSTKSLSQNEIDFKNALNRVLEHYRREFDEVVVVNLFESRPLDGDWYYVPCSTSEVSVMQLKNFLVSQLKITDRDIEFKDKSQPMGNTKTYILFRKESIFPSVYNNNNFNHLMHHHHQQQQRSRKWLSMVWRCCGVGKRTAGPCLRFVTYLIFIVFLLTLIKTINSS